MDEKLKDIEIKIKNLTVLFVVGFIVIVLLIIGLYFTKGMISNKTNNTNNSSTNSGDTSYDVSKMNEVNVDGAVALFEEKGIKVLYIGRANCGVCVQIVPELNKVQEELKFTTNYFDLNKTNKWQTEMKPLTDLLTFKTTVKTNIQDKDGNTKTVTLNDTVGKIFIEYGFTPTVAIIKDGKMVDGFIGYKSAEDIKTIIEKYI